MRTESQLMNDVGKRQYAVHSLSVCDAGRIIPSPSYVLSIARNATHARQLSDI